MILAFLPFLVAMSFTPGPNNNMVASSGVNFGFRATIPHMLGIAVDVASMLLLIGFGLGQIFIALPVVHHGLKIVGTFYLYISRLANRDRIRRRYRRTHRPSARLAAGCRVSVRQCEGLAKRGLCHHDLHRDRCELVRSDM